MLTILIQILAGLALLVFGAEKFVSGAAGTMDQLAQRMQTQLGRFVV